MPTMDPIEEHRKFYAEFVTASAGVKDGRLAAAYASVPREDYLGKGPWQIWAHARCLTTPTDDPRWIYQDVVVALVPERGINNGQPSLHARCMGACAPGGGETVVQIGTGTGYYTAILAELVGPTGKVVAYEIDEGLAGRARENLRHLGNVRVENASACDGALPAADVIYVSAGATHPPASWLDALNPGGRLIFPLTRNDNFGVMLLITRQGDAGYAAKVVSSVGIIHCVGARDEAAAEALAKAVQTPAIMGAKSLHRGTEPDGTACFVGIGWWLSNAGAN
jgi:protein-L-isoaspartate(D-aspartate) O-methyltransferase